MQFSSPSFILGKTNVVAFSANALLEPERIEGVTSSHNPEDVEEVDVDTGMYVSKTGAPVRRTFVTFPVETVPGDHLPQHVVATNMTASLVTHPILTCSGPGVETAASVPSVTSSTVGEIQMDRVYAGSSIFFELSAYDSAYVREALKQHSDRSVVQLQLDYTDRFGREAILVLSEPYPLTGSADTTPVNDRVLADYSMHQWCEKN